MPTTSIIAIGDELVDGRMQDENSTFIASMLLPYGAVIRRITVVPDSPVELTSAIRQAMESSELIITTGGLGPTEMDHTRDVVATIAGTPTAINNLALETIRAVFRERGVTPIPEWAPKLARMPSGALALINPRGLAQGFIVQVGHISIVCLPGEPEQIPALWHDFLEPELVRRFVLCKNCLTHTLHVAGGEPATVRALDYWLSGQADPRVRISLRSKPGTVSVDLKVEAPQAVERESAMKAALADIYKKLGDAIYGENNDTVEDALVRVLVERSLTIAVAESSTGGAIASRIVNVPGAGQVFLEGMICYSNDCKTSRLSVPTEFLKMYGAVSESVAMAMAAGVRVVAGADVGLAVTGILGPDGGTEEKPVGTTWIACDVEGSMSTSSMVLSGGRRSIKRWSARAAINFARLSITRSGGAF